MKGVKKKFKKNILFSLYLGSKASDHQKVVSIPLTQGVIMGGRLKNFEDLMIASQDIRETKFPLLGFYLNIFNFRHHL